MPFSLARRILCVYNERRRVPFPAVFALWVRLSGREKGPFAPLPLCRGPRFKARSLEPRGEFFVFSAREKLGIRRGLPAVRTAARAGTAPRKGQGPRSPFLSPCDPFPLSPSFLPLLSSRALLRSLSFWCPAPWFSSRTDRGLLFPEAVQGQGAIRRALF